MRLRYLPQPGGSTESGLGAGFEKLGQSMSNMGKLYDKDMAQQQQFKLQSDANDRANTELELKKGKASQEEVEHEQRIKEAEWNLSEAKKTSKSKEEREKHMVTAFRKLHPKVGASLNDEELLAFGKDIDKLIPKGAKISKLDTRVTPKGNKMLTYEVNGEIVEKNLGPVKTDWNQSGRKGSSEIPEGFVRIDHDFYEKHKDQFPDQVKMAGDTRVASLSVINAVKGSLKGKALNQDMDETSKPVTHPDSLKLFINK